MKNFFVVLSLFCATMAYAVCPDVSGLYVCKDPDGDEEVEVAVSQRTDERGVTFNVNGMMEQVLLDGKTRVNSVMVPGAWGGIIFEQNSCEDNAIVIRGGLEVQVLNELRFSKTDDGALLFDTYDLETSDLEKLHEIFAPLQQEFQKSLESVRLSEDQLNEVVRDFVEKKSIPTWKETVKQNLIAKKALVCRKQ